MIEKTSIQWHIIGPQLLTKIASLKASNAKLRDALEGLLEGKSSNLFEVWVETSVKSKESHMKRLARSDKLWLAATAALESTKELSCSNT